MGETRKRGPGKPPTDIAWRLRNWVWYWSVRETLKRSDDQLDSDFLPQNSDKGTRRRAFHRLRTTGNDPTLPRVDLKNQTLFNRVHEAQGTALSDVYATFHSQLWKLLSNGSLTVEDYRDVISEMIAANGWYRATPDDRLLGATFMRDDAAFNITEDHEHVYSAMLTSLESNPSANNVALLAALFREALSSFNLERAAALRSSLRVCTSFWVRSIELPPQIARLLESLIQERLVRGVWRTPKIRVATSQTQSQFIKALVRAYLAEPVESADSMCVDLPIVLRSPRIEWLEAHKNLLTHAAQEIRNAQAMSAQLSDSENSVLRAQAREWKEYEEHIHASIEPPPRDLCFCLPVYAGHGVRSRNRPAPYLTDGTLDDQML